MVQIESPADLWDLLSEELKKQMTDVSFDLWLRDLKAIEMRKDEFVVGVANEYKKSIVEGNYKKMIEDELERMMSLSIKLKVVLLDENGNVIPSTAPVVGEATDSEFTFDNFIVGPTNRFAHAASMVVADNQNIIYNPLVIYGRSGVGKTHLMLAIQNHIAKKFPEKRVEYIRCEDFTNQLISALHDGKLGTAAMDDFRSRFRNVDVLLLDDIQFIAGKETTQEEFFNTFNALHQNKKQIVVTCDRPPKDIRTLDDRIRSRLESGLFADIVPPDFETKVGIVIKMANQLNITVPENVVYYIAEHIQDNTRQLEGVVKKIQALILIDQKTPTLSAVQGFIKEVVNDTLSEPIRIEKIITEVARTYNVSEKDILSRRRTDDIATARQIAMYIARETTDLPYQSIGEAFGKNHTTVLYNEREVKKLIEKDSSQKAIIEDIIKNLRSE